MPTRRPYSTDLSGEEWEILRPLVPEAKPGGRKRHLLVDTEGLMIVVAVHEADIADRVRRKKGNVGRGHALGPTSCPYSPSGLETVRKVIRATPGP